MSSKLLIILALLIAYNLLTVSTRKKGKRSYCKGPDGKYKIGQSYNDGCYLKTCIRIRRKAIWQSKLLPNQCCKYEGKIVPDGFQDAVTNDDGLITFSCSHGRIKKGSIPAPPEELFTTNSTIPGNTTSDFLKLINGACHGSHAIAKDGLFFLRNSKPEFSPTLHKKLLVERKRVLAEKDVWICGTSQVLLLIKNKKVREEVSRLLPQELQGNGVSESETADVPNKRIIGGTPAGPGLIPWQGLIMRVFPWGSTWATSCGCVLIHSCYVLTARHCTAGLWDPSLQMSIILGDVNVPVLPVSPGTYSGPGQERHVMYVHYHPDPDYDVALILLKSSTSVPSGSRNPIIKPIKIANFYPPANSWARVSGFGWTTSGSGPTSPILRYAKNKVPSFYTCQNHWSTIGFPGINLAAHEICAGGFNPYVGACHGDSGGPLTQADPSTSEQKLIGLMERGIGGCSTNMKYAIYVNPSFPAIKGWIDSILPVSEPTGNMGHENGTGHQCACLRPAIKFNGQPTNAFPFNSIHNRNCFLKWFNPLRTCGAGSPTIPIPIGKWTAFTSPIVCWAGLWLTGSPWPSIWTKDCSKQFPYNGKMYLGQWNPFDCPLDLDPVPEYTHAYIASGNIGFWNFKHYYYGYAKQQFTNDAALDFNATICFSSLSMVTLSTGEMVSVSRVKIGDYLQTVDTTGKMVNSPFLGWLHKDQNIKTFFLNIITENNSFVSLSPLHLILVTKSLHQKPTMKFANSVSVGDYLVSPHSEFLLKVVAISQDIQKGVYAPLTETGTILVDGLVASCYAHIANHDIAHLGFLPVRLLPGLLEDRNSQNKDGMRTYLEYLITFAKPLIIYSKDASKLEELSLTSIASGFLASLISV